MPNYLQYHRQGNIPAYTLSSEAQSNWEFIEYATNGIDNRSGSPPSIEPGTGFYLFPDNQVRTVIGSVTYPHGVDQNGDFVPAIKWSKYTDGPGEVAWKIKYKLIEVGDTIPDEYTELGLSQETQYKHQDTKGLHAINTWATQDVDQDYDENPLGVVISFQIDRDTDDPFDTYEGMARMFAFGIYVQVDTIGSEELFVK